MKGFTLIELMIILIVVGVLAMIALPMYDNYVARAQASEAPYLLDGLRTRMYEEGK